MQAVYFDWKVISLPSYHLVLSRVNWMYFNFDLEIGFPVVLLDIETAIRKNNGISQSCILLECSCKQPDVITQNFVELADPTASKHASCIELSLKLGPADNGLKSYMPSNSRTNSRCETILLNHLIFNEFPNFPLFSAYYYL